MIEQTATGPGTTPGQVRGRTLLVCPLSPREPGNGLAHRARAWQAALARLGPVTTVVVPVAGPARKDGSINVRPVRPDARTAHLPAGARSAPEQLGRAWAAQHDVEVDLVVALRAWTAPFALGVAEHRGAALVVDLDDDEPALLAATGQQQEAERAADLVAVLRRRADLLTSAGGHVGTTHVPNSIAAVPTPRSVPSSPTVLLVGNFGYGPNVEGARWFLDHVLPGVVAAVPEADAVLVGPRSDTEFPGTGRGLVHHLADVYAAAAAAVVPLLHGSGTRIKALEAFAHGVPVVGTTLGLEGLGVVDGTSALVRDSAEEFAAAVVGLLTDQDEARRVGEGGRALSARWDADVVAQQTAALLEGLLAAPGRVVYARAPRLTLLEEESGLVVLEEDGLTAHELNAFAAAVLTLVEQPLSAPEVVARAAAWFPADGLEQVVADALSALARAGLLQRERAPESP